MPRRDATSPEVRRQYDRLRALSLDHEAQARYATEIAASEPHSELLRAALAVLAAHPQPAARETLLRRYAEHDSPRRDAGGFVRAAILSALRRVAVIADASVFERATTTYEPSPQDADAPALLRAAGLVALNDLDDVRASFHAIRILAGDGRPGMGPEPSLTAVRVLAANGHVLPLYALALPGPQRATGDVLGECLRGLAPAPGDLLAPVFAGLEREHDDVALLGLCDLLVAHAEDAAVTATLERWLARMESPEVYGYLVAAVAASRAPHLAAALTRAAAAETTRVRLRALAESLALLESFPGVKDTLATVRERLQAAP